MVSVENGEAFARIPSMQWMEEMLGAKLTGEGMRTYADMVGTHGETAANSSSAHLTEPVGEHDVTPAVEEDSNGDAARDEWIVLKTIPCATCMLHLMVPKTLTSLADDDLRKHASAWLESH